MHGTYRGDVTGDAVQEARSRAWAAYVGRILNDMKLTRSLTVEAIASTTGVSRATIYRWKNADWSKGPPKHETVFDFLHGLGLSLGPAPEMLGWVENAALRGSADPLPMDPDVEQLMRKLRDPNVSDAEKLTIRATVRHLGQAPAGESPPDSTEGRSSTG